MQHAHRRLAAELFDQVLRLCVTTIGWPIGRQPWLTTVCTSSGPLTLTPTKPLSYRWSFRISAFSPGWVRAAGHAADQRRVRGELVEQLHVLQQRRRERVAQSRSASRPRGHRASAQRVRIGQQRPPIVGADIERMNSHARQLADEQRHARRGLDLDIAADHALGRAADDRLRVQVAPQRRATIDAASSTRVRREEHERHVNVARAAPVFLAARGDVGRGVVGRFVVADERMKLHAIRLFCSRPRLRGKGGGQVHEIRDDQEDDGELDRVEQSRPAAERCTHQRHRVEHYRPQRR